MTVHYTDQNNNSYLLTETTFKYIPITEKESSSGTYNGGEYVSKSMAASDFKMVLELAEEIVASAPKNVKREMLTSILNISKNGTIERVTLRKSTKRSQLEDLLRAFKEESE